MKTIKFLVLILTLSLFTACGKKKYETTVSGYVTEKNGDRKIAGAKVYLVEMTSSTYHMSKTFHDSLISGPDGSYYFKFNLGEGDFRVEAVAENYYPLEMPTDKSKRGILSFGKDQDYNVELWPFAWLKMRFVNQSGADFVNVNRTFGESDFHINVPDATVVGLVKGNDTTRINYFVYPGGEPRAHFIYCPGLDTTNTEIYY